MEIWCPQYTLGGMRIARSFRRTAAVVAALALLVSVPASAVSKPVFKTVDAATFLQIAKQKNVIVIDVRRPDEFASGHIARAINLDYEAGVLAARFPKLKKTATYAIYCHSGRRSGLALAAMQAAGFTRVYNLDGGVIAWANAGYPFSLK